MKANHSIRVYLLIKNSIAICIWVTRVTFPIAVCVLLSRVWNGDTVILVMKTQNDSAVLETDKLYLQSKSIQTASLPWLPFCKWGLCSEASRPGSRRCLCLFRRENHFQPTQCHTKAHKWSLYHQTQYIWSLYVWHVCDICVIVYLTSDGPVSLLYAQSVWVAGVVQAVSAAFLWLTTSDLITCETGLTSATLIWSLHARKHGD